MKQLTEQEEKSIKSTLKKFVFSLRNSTVTYKVFKYYTQTFEERLSKSRAKIEFDFEGIELQIKRKILSSHSSDPYWSNIKTSEVSLLESFVSVNGLSSFKDYINELLKYNISDFKKEQKEEQKELESLEDKNLIKFLAPKEDLLLIPVKNILKNNIEFKYKSDKVKALLDIQLNSDQIFGILSNYEDFVVTRSYIEKFKAERQQMIIENKIKSYPQEEAVKKYLKL